MKQGSHGLSAEERHWLRTICRATSEDGDQAAIAIPTAIREVLLAKGLIQPSGGSFEVTAAGLAEAIRIC